MRDVVAFKYSACINTGGGDDDDDDDDDYDDDYSGGSIALSCSGQCLYYL